MFPSGDGREEALSRRSKTIPKEYYIGDRRDKRKAASDIYDRVKPAQPKPKQGTKREAVAPPSATIVQDSRRPPPKPRGRLEAKDGDRKIPRQKKKQ